MKVKKLIQILEKLDPNLKVILSKDGEGNGFSPLNGESLGKYVPDCTWSGEIAEEGKINAVILWPIN